MKCALLCAAAIGCGDNRAVSPDASATPRCGSTPFQLIDSKTFIPDDAPIGLGIANPFLAVDRGYLYYNLAYVPPNGSPPVGGHIRRVELAGGDPVDIADSPHPGHFAIADSRVLFADDTQGILAAPITGGAASSIAASSGQPGWVAFAGSTLYFADGAGIERVETAGSGTRRVTDHAAFSFAPIAESLVLADFSGGTVASVPTDGGALTPIASSQLGPLYPVHCGADACWIDAGDLATKIGTFVRGGAAVVASADLFHPHGMAADDDNAFAIAEGNGNTISRISLATGQLDVLAHAHGAGDIALDDTCIYYSTFDGVFSLRKDAPAL
jgi:hypothetical protein